MCRNFRSRNAKNCKLMPQNKGIPVKLKAPASVHVLRLHTALTGFMCGLPLRAGARAGAALARSSNVREPSIASSVDMCELSVRPS